MGEHKLPRRRLLQAAAASATGLAVSDSITAQPDRHIVGIRTQAALNAAKQRADSVYRVLDFGAIGQAVAGVFTEQALDALRQRAGVRYIEPDGTWHAIAQSYPWGIDRVDADVAHSNGATGSGADIAIIDTGIDDDHPDLQANIGAGKAYVNCRGSNCNYPWSDDHDHGTHCAGIADASNNSEGVVGVSTDATLHAVKVLDNRGSGSWSDVAAGIEYTADQGWDVGSLSLGGSSGSQTVKDACTYAYNNGVLLVAAAGNNGPCSDCVSYPAKYSECIAVSATSKNDSLAGFSSTGPEIELAAPGDNINSTVIGGYSTFDGTSMACPHVSGAGGQLMANGYSNSDARSQLKSTAEDIGLSSNKQGKGLLDVAAALGFDSSDDLGSSDNAPTVDSLSLTEVETSDADAEFDASWQVSDADGDLEQVDLTLTDTDDGETEESTSVTVSGDTASDTTRLVATDEDGSGHTYQVELTVTDANGNTATDTATTTESEDTSGAPTASIDSVSEQNSPNPHAEFDIAWNATDDDGNLDTADLTLSDDTDGETEDSETVDISGGSASATTRLTAKHDDGSGNQYTVELVVTDANGNTASDSATFSEDGSGTNAQATDQTTTTTAEPTTTTTTEQAGTSGVQTTTTTTNEPTTTTTTNEPTTTTTTTTTEVADAGSEETTTTTEAATTTTQQAVVGGIAGLGGLSGLVAGLQSWLDTSDN